jgi:hypothetical protein
MLKEKMPNGRGTLRKYEVKNLILFLFFILALGGVGSYVFQTYKNKNKPPEKPFNDKGIVNEFVSQTSSSCYFYVGTQLSESQHSYRSRRDIPANDDGFITGLFAIRGVVSVTVDPGLVVLQKEPKGHWEEIQPAARIIINAHLHMHR